MQEHDSVKKMWEEYLTSIGEKIETTNKQYTSWYFCNNESSAKSLAELVKEGVKRGTASLYELFQQGKEELPKAGDYSIITDWNGIAQFIIQTKKVTILPFEEVTEEMARIEGEGDKSLDYWQRVHDEFFTSEAQENGLMFTHKSLVVFEEFEVVYQDESSKMMEEDRIAIENACKDYVEGFFEQNSQRIQNGVHEKLVKRNIQNEGFNEMSREQLIQCSLMQQIEKPEIKVEVYRIHGNIATAAIYSAFVDYVHLVRLEGNWKVVNVLWDFL